MGRRTDLGNSSVQTDCARGVWAWVGVRRRTVEARMREKCMVDVGLGG